MDTLLVIKLTLVLSTLIHQSLAVICKRPVPGFTKLLSAVDITTMDLFPLEDGNVGGMKSHIIQNTCAFGWNWSTRTGKVYSRPNQIRNIIRYSEGTHVPHVEVYRSYKEAKNKMSQAVGLIGFFKTFAFSMSSNFVKIQNGITRFNKHVLDVTSEEVSHTIYLNYAAQYGFLLDSFKKAMNNLNKKTYKANRDAFDAFVETYGTHYIKWGAFGGMVRKYIETSSSYTLGKSDYHLKVQAEKSYNVLMTRLGEKIKSSYGYTEIDEQFEQSSTEIVKHYGGEGNLIAKNGFKNWRETVENDPALLKIGLTPLYKLVTYNRVLKKQLKIAINQYVMRRFLNELDRKLVTALYKWDTCHVLNNFLEEVKQIKENEFLDKFKITSLTSDIVDHTEIPVWFSQRTNLCMSYRPVKSGNTECNGRTTTTFGTMCSSVNRYTSPYLDRTGTGKIRAGCQMWWMIVSPNSPEWFRKNVKICVKHAVDDTTYTTEDIKCNVVGHHAGPFWDDSGLLPRPKMNSLNWKIELPDNAPLWMTHSKLCFKWAPTDPTPNAFSSCLGVSKTLCAKPGEWTDTYVDWTNNLFDVGCKMQWTWQI